MSLEDIVNPEEYAERVYNGTKRELVENMRDLATNVAKQGCKKRFNDGKLTKCYAKVEDMRYKDFSLSPTYLKVLEETRNISKKKTNS